MRGVRTVVHLAGAIRDQPAGSIEELNGIATWRMVQAAERAGVEHFVFVSALGAVEPRPHALPARQGARRARRARLRRAPHGLRAVARLRARRRVPHAARADGDGAAGRAGQRPRAGALPADLGRGRRRRASPPRSPARRRRRRPRALRARRPADALATAQIVELVLRAGGPPAAARQRADADRQPRPARRRDVHEVARAGDVGRGRAARGLDDLAAAAPRTPRRCGVTPRAMARGARRSRADVAARPAPARRAHGAAASSCAASASSAPSCAGRPMSCTASGRPSSCSYSGSEIAGEPVTLLIAV